MLVKLKLMIRRQIKAIVDVLSAFFKQLRLHTRLLICLVFLMMIAVGIAGFNGWMNQHKSPSPLFQKNPSPHIITFAVAQAPLNLDPRYASDAASARVNRLLYESLVTFDAAYKPIPSLASWEVLSNVHYRFTLTNATHIFHDGTLLTADDVVATYQSLLTLQDSPHRAEFSHIKKIWAIDARTFEIALSQPDDFFIEKLVIGILPAHEILKERQFVRSPLGSGPLKLSAWQQHLLLERVIDGQKIAVMEVKDPTVRVLKLIRGEVDILQGDLPPELVGYLAQQKAVRLQSAVGTNFSYLGINFNDVLLQHPSVRLALAHAIDVQTMLQKGLVPQSRVASVILPPEHYANGQTLVPYDYNPVLAKKLLQEANISLPLKLEYKTSTDPQRVRFATMMQAQMANAGIELTIKSVDWGTFFDDVKQGHFQLYGLTWVGINTPDIYLKAFGSNALPPQGLNRGHYADARLDALLLKHDWPLVTQHLYQHLPVIPLWYEGQFVAMQNSIVDYQLKSDGAWDALAQVQFRPQ